MNDAALSPPSPSLVRRPTAVAAWLGLVVLGALMITSAINTSIIYLNLEGLKQSIGLSDTQVGALSGLALTLVSAIAVIPLGWLADRVNRLWLLASCVAIWSLATIGFALANSFESLFGFTMGIAIGEAVLGPIIYSLIPDLFPREKWLQANLVMFIMGRLGGFAALTVAGALLAFASAQANQLPAFMADLEPWRIALILSIVTAPVLIVLTLMIPVRRAKAPVVAAEANASGLLDYFRSNARTLVGVFFGFGIIYASNNGTAVWFPTALHRAYGVDPAQIGVTLGTTSAIGAALGIVIAFMLARWLRPRFGDTTPMILAQIATIAIIVTTPLLLVVPSLAGAYVLAAIKNLALTVCLSLSPAVLQVLAPSFLRGRVIAIGGSISVLIMSVSPIIVGTLSDRVFSGPQALMTAIVALSTIACVIGLALLRFGGSRLPATIAAAEAADIRAEAAEARRAS